MAGAPGRERMVEELLAALQAHVEEEDQEEEGGKTRPPRKKRKTNKDKDTTRETFFPMVLQNPCLPPPCETYPIPRRSALSMEQFGNHLPSAQPLVITQALRHWPAFGERAWNSPDYLLKKTFGGRRLVPVEVGRSYTDVGWGQSIITFKEFMDRYMLHNPQHGQEGIAYLAQHDLFAQIPSLRNDISVPDYCYTDPPQPAPGTPLALKEPPAKLDEPLLNAWFGPAGTVSPLHTDPYHNILCQVVGKKYVRVYCPEETEKLYARGIEEGGVDMSNTSQVDVEGDEEERDRQFPNFKRAKYMETVLQEGECLYIPVGWWHYVRSLGASFSVSFWWN
ncbi:MAG: hypothetical protein Q9163_005461 [Psora crenata]